MNFDRILAAVPFLSVFATLSFAQTPAQAPFATHQLSPNLYWIDGGGGNSGVIVGRAGVIVIDAKISEAGGKELLDDIAKITPKPVTTVIETHSDRDHIAGLAAFPKGVAIVAHENNKKEQEDAIAAGRGAVTADRLPTRLVSKQKETLNIEGVAIEVYHWGPAHTNGDLIVYLPAEKVVFAGDIRSPEQPDPIIHPEKNGTSEGWIATTKGMLGLNAERYVPGHGNVETKAAIQTALDAAVAKRAKIKELVAQGKSLDEIRVAVGDPPAGRIVTFTEVVYKELKP
jgi:glyoxylase-like metal-dependent hydrolase (beta-lactamase superfamily II)